MYSVNVEKRNPEIKAKKIRKSGMTPCSIADGKTKETMMIQIPEGEAKKLLRSKGRGSQVLLQYEDQKYHVIIKEIMQSQLNNQIEDITFQRLYEDEYVNSFARVILKNRDKVQTMVYQSVTEIPYRALSQHLVEEIEIDLAKIKSGMGLLLKDLEIWTNEKIQLSMKEHTPIVKVS